MPEIGGERSRKRRTSFRFLVGAIDNSIASRLWHGPCIYQCGDVGHSVVEKSYFPLSCRISRDKFIVFSRLATLLAMVLSEVARIY